MEPKVLLSLVVPVHDETGSVEPFLARALPVLAEVVGRFGPSLTFEIVFVDDGSTDATLAELRAARSADQRVKIVVLSRNFGKDTALAAGLAYASGMAVIPIDVDLQDPPELIPSMVDRWMAGYDIVNARRVDRSADSWTKRKTAGAFYRVFNSVADRPIPPDAGDFRLISRQIVDILNRFPERARFMKGLFAWVGFAQCSVDYVRPERECGASKWRYWRLWNFAIDGITSSTTMPLRVWTYFGAGVALIAFAYATALILRTLIFGADVPGYASLTVMVLLFGGLNLLSLGIIGEYLGRTYTEVKGRPLYIVRHAFGFGGEAEERGLAWNEPSTSEWLTRKTSIGGSMGAGGSSSG
ncbi:MAG: glycosyltransferase family 2 protein [Pseudomonadota bacterium]|nr:glycosyltransferase family 2 protein [Pseudomonadota bacterium]